MIDDYILYYNNVRYHKGIGLITPNEKEEKYYLLNHATKF